MVLRAPSARREGLPDDERRHALWCSSLHDILPETMLIVSTFIFP